MKFMGLRCGVVGVACAMVLVSPAQAATIDDDVANGPRSGEKWVGDPHCSIQTANDNAADGGVALSNNMENPPETTINERRGLPQVRAGDDTSAASGTLLGAAPDLLVSAAFDNTVLRYDGITGSFVGVVAAGAGLGFPEGLKFGADGNLYVSSFFSDEVLRYDGETGAFIDVFASGPELAGPFGMQFGPDGNLFVSNRSAPNILRFNGVTGEFIDIFAVGGGLQTPEGLTFGPDGNIYVSSDGTSSVLRYDGVTGDFIDVFAAGGGLSSPEDLVFGPDGNLYVSSFDTDNVLRFDGSTGSFLGVFAEDPSLEAPSGLIFGSDGSLFVSGFNSDNIVRFDGATGAFIDVFATGGDLDGPTYLTFTDSGCLTQTSIEIICHADGTTFTVNVEGLNACTGGTTQFTFTASGGAAGEELCFTILVNADGGFCCSTEICVTIPDCSAQVQICDFESLSVGDVVTDQYPGATFSSTPGNENVVLSGFETKFICTRPAGQFQTCIEETFVDFTNPVNSLSFQAIALNTIGIVAAQVNVFVNGSFDSTVDIIGTGDSFPIIDLTAFSNVTRVEIVNIIGDPMARNGIGWDNFSFMTGMPSDLNGDGVVDIQDFLAFLGAWGQCADCGTPPACPADLDGDCSVGILDLLILLGNWG